MKNKLIILAGISLAMLTQGCFVTSSGVAKEIEKLEALGVTKIEITGKFSHTDYNVTKEDGKRKAVFIHSNSWLSHVEVVRETEE
jgi:hypothetical protein